eukprot:803536-Lingulodinium_polyedra.AAC.1
MPLVAPTRSFTGAPRWDAYIGGLPPAKGAFGPGDRDYLLPKPLPGMAGFAPEPCPTHTARKLLQALLARANLDPQTVEKVTLSSLRLFMHNLAYAKGIPRHLRRYLG